ncbi:unnamed protein product [Schistosoma margrebowiei]|uniref:Uncharacterized protein n=1 Tax=Schistosoma margrebowiei TaxID=48269 RepID=A0A183LJI6_9TREM|nr:unnamed protein product [Schistosoma margrebowiei]
MVVGGSQQETLDPGFVLFGTRQQGVPVILRELVLPGGFELNTHLFMVYVFVFQLSTSICYMDCSPNCLLNENGCTIPRSIAQVIEGCQFKRINASTFQYQYIINMEELDHTGLWNCEYRGQRAVRSLELQAAETFPTNISNASDNPDNNITSNNKDIQIKNGLLQQNRTNIVNQSHRNNKNQSKFNKINSNATKSEMTENRKNTNNLDEATMETMHQTNAGLFSPTNNNNLHQHCEFHQFNDSSNNRLHNQNDIQELNINPTIYPVH